MTVASETSRVVYTGAGITGPFSVPFYFLEDADLTVIKTLISDGTETDLVLTTDYTVTGAAVPAGGSITLTSALSALYKLTIVRDPDSLQETDYQTGDPFPAESHERALDKLTMIVQRVLDKVNRAFRLSDGDVSGVGLTLSNLGANRILVVNSTGTGIEGADVVDVNLTPVTAFTATLLNDADAAEAQATLGLLIGVDVQAYDADIAKVDAANVFSLKNTFTGTMKLQQSLEKITITASAPASTQNFDALSQAIQYFTTAGANNWTLNVRGDSGASLNSIMAVGESLTLTVLATMTGTPYYATALNIDGAAVTPKWIGGTAPSGGDASCINIYTYTVIKTADAAFTVLASKAKTS